ncbi:MAG: transcription/translation regulatory transformer protein RfaH [Legionella sp.]|nr:MAG: transcription/translation regulatory transformer protein RfaH [Legionella sp.]
MYEDSRWYLVQCKPRESFRAELHLSNQGYQCFHPTYPVKKQISGLVKTVNFPLFPYYLFVLLSATSTWSTIRSTRGVNRLVSFNGIPASLDHNIIDGLQRHCARLNGHEAPPLFNCGDRVLITDGCFKELEAIVIATKGEERVSLLLNLFNRQQSLDLPISALKICR